MASKRARNSIVVVVAIAFIIGAGLALFSIFDESAPVPAGSNSQTPGSLASSGGSEGEHEETGGPPAIPADFTLQPARNTTIRSHEFPRNRPVRLGLTLPVPATRFEPMRARITDANGRSLHAKAIVQGREMNIANLEIEPEWLLPGRYLVQLTTQELSHLPVRRYPLEVR